MPMNTSPKQTPECDIIDEAFPHVVAMLEHAHGEHNALTLDEITARAGLPTRRTAEELFETRLSLFPYPVVAGGAGYFRPLHARNLNAYINSLRSRAVKCFLRARKVRRLALKAGWPMEGRAFAEPPKQLEFDEQGSGFRVQEKQEQKGQVA